MCNDYEKINDLIRAKRENPYRGLDDGTYINESVWKDFAEHRDLKKVWIAMLKTKYQWTNEQADRLYEKTADGWFDGKGTYRLFDFGRGKNKICKENNIDRDFHEPQHDHIVSRTEAKLLGWPDEQINDPSNIQVISAIQNRAKSSFNKEQWDSVYPTIGKLFAME